MWSFAAKLVVFIALLVNSNTICVTAQRNCEAALALKPVGNVCTCTRKFTVRTGVTINMACESETPMCIVKRPKPICTTPSMAFEYHAKNDASTTNVTMDFSETAVFDDLLGFDWSKLTISLINKPSENFIPFPMERLESCTAMYGSKTCKRCSICSRQQGFSFDCTNVMLNPTAPKLLRLPFPPTGRCLKL